MSSLTIESSDVIKLCMQFLKENNLTQTLRSLQEETQVSMNTVDNIETFVSDITSGRWDVVLGQMATLRVPQEKLADLYEQIIIEMVELKEIDTAREMLRNTEPMATVKLEQPERYLRLEHMMNRSYFDPREVYRPGSSKEKRRVEISQALVSEVSVVPPARLLALLGQAVKWQYQQGAIANTKHFDLFRGATRSRREDSEEKPPKKQAGIIKFGKKSHPETARFSADGQMVVTGSVDGFVELWDVESCRLNKDLGYQARDELLMHDSAVLSACFSRDGDHMATGSQDGKIKVWKISTGACLRRFDGAHSGGVTGLEFGRDAAQLLSASFDHTARIHGLKSGRVLKEFRGHRSYVNSAHFTSDGQRVITGSSDGTTKIWDARTTDCLHTFRLPTGVSGGASSGSGSNTGSMGEAGVLSAVPLPRHPDQVVVCNRSNSVCITTLQGQVVRSFSSGKQQGGNFVCCTVSPQGKWIYCVGEDRVLYCFNVLSGQLDHVLPISDREVVGISHHPHRNILATFNVDGILKLWKP